LVPRSDEPTSRYYADRARCRLSRIVVAGEREPAIAASTNGEFLPVGDWYHSGLLHPIYLLLREDKNNKPLREVVWVILDHFRSAVFFCCCRCGHVGNALALSIMSTAMPGAMRTQRCSGNGARARGGVESDCRCG